MIGTLLNICSNIKMYILLALLGANVKGNCWQYDKSFENRKFISAKQMEPADLHKLEEFCTDFCLKEERYKAVLLDVRNWYCWVFDTAFDKITRNAPEVAIAFRSCLELQRGMYILHFFPIIISSLYHRFYRYKMYRCHLSYRNYLSHLFQIFQIFPWLWLTISSFSYTNT